MNCFDVLAQTRFLIIGGRTKLATVLFSFMHHKNMFPQSFFTLETITTFWTGVSGSFVMNKGNMFVQTFFCFVSITTSWTFKIFRSIMFNIHMSFQFSNLSEAQTAKMASKRLLSLMHCHNMAFHCKLTVENSFALLTFHRRRLFSFMHFSDVPFKRITSCENFVTLGAYSGLGFLPFMNPIYVTLHVAFVIKCLGAELTMVLFSFMNHQNVIQHGLFGRKVFHTMRT